MRKELEKGKKREEVKRTQKRCRRKIERRA